MYLDDRTRTRKTKNKTHKKIDEVDEGEEAEEDEDDLDKSPLVKAVAKSVKAILNQIPELHPSEKKTFLHRFDV